MPVNFWQLSIDTLKSKSFFAATFTKNFNNSGDQLPTWGHPAPASNFYPKAIRLSLTKSRRDLDYLNWRSTVLGTPELSELLPNHHQINIFYFARNNSYQIYILLSIHQQIDFYEQPHLL